MPYYPGLKDLLSIDSFYENKEEKLDHIANKILALKDALENQIPPKSRDNKLLLATFNIREFDSNRKKNGPRSVEAMYYLAEIISAFDLIAIQEVTQDLGPLKVLMLILGKDYNYFVTDITEGTSGNNERMAYIYDEKKISFRNVAGEIVLPGTTEKPALQFARSPYLVGFQAGWFKFNLCTVHIYYGKDSGAQFQRRVDEIEKLSMFFAKRAEKEKENFILLGDFNILDFDDVTMKALLKGGFKIPEKLTKRGGTNIKKDKFYDQIVYREGDNKVKFSGRAGVFDFYDIVYNDDEMDLYYEDYKNIMKLNNKPANKTQYNKDFKVWKSYQMSDHLPLWAEFEIDYSRSYLKYLTTLKAQ